jgi:hypothetical protein
MHYLILISLITRDSSILSSFIELQTNRQQKVSKKTKKTKKSTTITRMMMMRSEGTRVITLSKNGMSQLHPHSHPHPRRVIWG